MNTPQHHSQFSPKRLALVGVTAAAVVLWMWWMVENRAPKNDFTPPTGDEWSPYWTAAILSVLFVVVVDVVVFVVTARKRRTLPEHEKDWHGPDPHLDRAIPLAAYSPSPLMQRALRRTLAKQTDS